MIKSLPPYELQEVMLNRSDHVPGVTFMCIFYMVLIYLLANAVTFWHC